MATELTITETKALAKLGKDATKHHRLCLKSLGDAVYNANMAGAFLIQAKEGMPHGDWLDWITENFPDGCEKTAQNYMKIARNWTELEENRNAVADLSIRGVLKFLTKTRAPALEVEVETTIPVESDPTPQCRNCGSVEVDDDGDCAQCHEPEVRAPDTPPDAPEPEPDETPEPADGPRTRTHGDAREAFLTTIEDQLWGWVRSYPNDTETVAGRLEDLAAHLLDD